MYANDFAYYRAGGVVEALELLAEHEDAQLLAGAHGLVPRMRTGEESPPTLVDISGLDELSGIDLSASDGVLSIGALTTHDELANDETVREHAPALADAAGVLGDPQVRNGGTIGGNLAHGDARADLPAALLALGGTLEVRGPGGDREIAAVDCFEGHFETTVGDEELVTSIRIPTADDGIVASGYEKRRNPLSGYALVGVAAWIRLEESGDDADGDDHGSDSIADARVAVTGALEAPRRLSAIEDALVGATADADTVAEAAARAGDGLDAEEFRFDVQASPEYREHLLSVYTEQVLGRVLGLE